jgi:hypothetical protein
MLDKSPNKPCGDKAEKPATGAEKSTAAVLPAKLYCTEGSASSEKSKQERAAQSPENELELFESLLKEAKNEHPKR